MKIIFIRHGDPNYKNDCLTPLGRLQAEAAAKRLADEGIQRIYSSTNGRAYETAEYTASLYGLDIIPCDFMREISWEPLEGEILDETNPWRITRKMVSRGESLMSVDFAERYPYKGNAIVKNAKKVADELDKWLEDLGYKREGDFYRVMNPQYNVVAMFCHGASSTAVLSHVYNLPLPFAFSTVVVGRAGILFEVILEGEVGDLIAPKLGIVNDCRHTKGIKLENDLEFN